MPQNALDFGKRCKNRRSIGGSTPTPPLVSGGWGLCRQTPSCYFHLKGH